MKISDSQKWDTFSLVGIFLLILPAGCSKPSDKTPADNPKVTGDMIRQKQKDLYAILHFWDGFDFSDTCCIHRPYITEQAFADYIGLLAKSSDTSVVHKSIYAMLTQQAQKQDSTVRVYSYLLELYAHYLYETNSPLRSDELPYWNLFCRIEQLNVHKGKEPVLSWICFSRTDWGHPLPILALLLPSKSKPTCTRFKAPCCCFAFTIRMVQLVKKQQLI